MYFEFSTNSALQKGFKKISVQKLVKYNIMHCIGIYCMRVYLVNGKREIWIQN